MKLFKKYSIKILYSNILLRNVYILDPNCILFSNNIIVNLIIFLLVI